eukprot:2559433-Pyramimonas_sp.AAC.1
MEAVTSLPMHVHAACIFPWVSPRGIRGNGWAQPETKVKSNGAYLKARPLGEQSGHDDTRMLS